MKKTGMKNILVAGGAGYIGSHMCKYLAKHGYQPIVLDNLVCGHRGAVRWGPLIEGSLSESRILKRLFSDNSISAVMHFAAFTYVGESVENPLRYYQNNVVETLCLLKEMIQSGVRCFIFSSSCAVYGQALDCPIDESHPTQPLNPYGRSKLVVEQILDDFHKAYGLDYISLRYFNAAGTDADGEIGEDHRPETHLIPLALEAALGKRDAIHVFGDDYPTKDGTCIRDYIHVEDLAQAHLLALERLLEGKPGGTYNLGNGVGYSVRDVVGSVRNVTGKSIPVKISKKRPGDATVLVASSHKVRRELEWHPHYTDLSAIIETAWRWYKKHPNGYASL